MDCAQTATMVRDHTLIVGLIVPLALFVALLIAGRVQLGRPSLPRFLHRSAKAAPDCRAPTLPLAISGPQAAADKDD